MEKVIVIVGASRGIGQATALALAQPHHHIVLAARNETLLDAVAATLRGNVASVLAVGCDVTNETQVRRLMEVSQSITGQIDVLVNSAGVAVVKPFEQCTLNDWNRSMHTGLTGIFLTCKHAVNAMPPGGLIINIASIASRQGIPTWSAYCAAKYGLLGFSNAIREELRPRSIRVTVVIPAATDTPLWDDIPGDWNRTNMLQPADVARPIANLVEYSPTAAVEELVIGHVAGML
jgi:NAD(P)-dependent dehydrogenase (short-subunit alcohol dehydrogenase family)